MSGPLRHILLGTRVALSRPGLVTVYGFVELVSGLTVLLPLLLAGALLTQAIASVLPLAVLSFDGAILSQTVIARISSSSFLLPVLGLALSGTLLSGVLRIFVLAGSLGVFSEDLRGRAPASTFIENACARFPAGLGAGLLIVLIGVALAGWSGIMLWSGAVLFDHSLTDPNASHLGAAAALAFIIVLFLFSVFFFEVLVRLTLIKVLVGGEGPVVGFWEAVSLIGRRLGAVLTIAAFFILAQLLLAIVLSTTSMPLTFLAVEASMSRWGIAARLVLLLIQTLAGAVLTLAAYSAFSALVLDDEGELPEPTRREPVLPPKTTEPPVPLLIARPMEPVAKAVPILPAKPIEEDT